MFAMPEHRTTKPSRFAVVGSVGLHALLAFGMIAGALKSGAADEFQYKVYKVDLYSPPPQELGEPEAPKPQPAIVRPEPPKEKTAVKEEKSPARTPTPKKTVTPSSKTGKSEVARGRNPDPQSLVGGEGVDVRLEGEDFPYPEYLENIILQLNRYSGGAEHQTWKRRLASKSCAMARCGGSEC